MLHRAFKKDRFRLPSDMNHFPPIIRTGVPHATRERKEFHLRYVDSLRMFMPQQVTERLEQFSYSVQSGGRRRMQRAIDKRGERLASDNEVCQRNQRNSKWPPELPFPPSAEKSRSRR